jgi:protein-S-isoprenylcysteine O-methyltransferase Ste14
MVENAAIIVFAVVWWVLIAIAIVAAFMFERKPYMNRAGPIMNALIITPFVFAFGLFYLARYFGIYGVSTIGRISGAFMMVAGLAGYIVSHCYLRENWSLGASVKEGHKLVTGGPYRVVRHPMYSSMILEVLGSGLLLGNYLMIASTIIVGAVYYVRARKEEELLKQEFPEYQGYAAKTRMLMPWLL